jgi:hypothetical protein
MSICALRHLIVNTGNINFEVLFYCYFASYNAGNPPAL